MGHGQQVARRYHDASTSGDSDTVAMLLAPTFRFEGGERRIDGWEAFLDSGRSLSGIFVTDMAKFARFVRIAAA